MIINSLYAFSVGGWVAGLGKRLNSLVIAFIRALILKIIFSYIFAVILNFGQTGVWFGIVIENILGGIIAYIWSKLYIRKISNENIENKDIIKN
ncbi:hypothetical protein ALNOE001_05520 [Candidatus Methanobinarius endosymbioticus]|uniref:Uncharacterized protein n=1 Tax=Candidatus Methanobinarius endosymbioticus TaxID=2006182 RepID=A0A366MEJ6_9EURY|nr:hypothetical protein ALNOE001_05520 [Candidatus Methanobinarius endosymbioticus]